MREKKIYKDLVFILLMLNMLLVLISYSYNSINRTISTDLTLLRQILIGFSILQIFFKKNPKNRLTNQTTLLPIAILFLALLNINFQETFFRTMTFMFPFVYVLAAINYLLSEYNFQNILHTIISGINLIYIYPVLTYFLLDAGFTKTNIYGIHEESYFFSNQYGWAATIYLCSFPIAFIHFSEFKPWKFFLVIVLILAAYLLLVSANRSSIFSLIVSILTYAIASNGKLNKARKNLSLLPLLVIFPLFFYFQLKEDKRSSISFLKAKNEKQFETNELQESRIVVTKYAFQEFNNNPYLWITGVGIFNHNFIQGISNLGAYHNSYWEILFGCGVPIFILFLNIMVFRPLKLLYYDLGGNYILIIPLIIIPYFESNITGGQFLFFPWFILMLLLNAKSIKPRMPDSIPATAVAAS